MSTSTVQLSFIGSAVAAVLAFFIFELPESGSDVAAMESQEEHEETASLESDEPGHEVIAGLRGLTVVSRVVFLSAPDSPHSFETNYIFPDRARWWLSFEDEDYGYRRAEYRYGDRIFIFDAGSSTSEELLELDHADSMRRMELRRALFLYPDGFEWKLDAKTGTTALGELSDGSAIGSLVVELDSDDRPARMRVLTPEGEEQETLAVERWKKKNDRNWPELLQLVVGEQVVWTETVLKVDPGRRYIDSFFIPVDRRAGGAQELGVDTNTEVRQIDLPIFAYRNFELPAKTTWTDALRLGREIWERENKPGSAVRGRLDPDLRFEIDARGRPTFAVLHLAETSPLPDQWQLTEARSGLMIVLDKFEHLSGSRIDGLLRSIPVGSRPTPAYARTIGEQESYRVQVLLPLVPID